jgi:hypothetical protein
MGLFSKDGPEPATVNQKPLTCQVCSNGLFWQREASLHGLFNLKWTAPTCTCLVCSTCGYVHWFLPEI